MQLAIISPEKKILETECTGVTIPTAEGLITVLPHHTPLYSLLAPGEVLVKNGQQTSTIVVNGGFVTVVNNKVTLLPDFGVRIEDIDEEIISQARERAEKAMEERVSDESYATNRAELFKALLQLKAIKKHHSKTL